MRYYPVVGAVHYKDKVFSLKLDFMAKYIEKKMAQCTNPMCKYHVLLTTAVRRMRYGNMVLLPLQPGQVRCFRCGGIMEEMYDRCIKFYTYVDPRINVRWDLFHGLIQGAHGILLLRKSESKYFAQRQELFVLIDSYDEFKNVVEHLHIKTGGQDLAHGLGWGKSRMKFTGSWVLKKMPTEEELQQAFMKYKLRKLADAI